MKKKILLMLLMLVMVFSFGTSIEAQAKTTTITIKSANTSTAKKLDKQLKKGKKFTVKVKGSKTSSKKLLDKTNAKLQKVNKYSVKMNTKRSKSSKGYTYYTVSADNAKLYKYTIDFLTDAYTKNEFNAVWTEERIVKADDFEETGNWEKEEVGFSEYYSYKQLWKKDFCNLTTLQQARVITAQIRDYITYCGDKDIQVNKKGYTKSQLMQRLATKKAKGECGDFALYQCLIFDQIGIPSYLNLSYKANHGVVAFKVANSSGKTGWVASEYGYWSTPFFMGDWTFRNATSKVIKDAKAHSFTADDVKEIRVKGYDDNDTFINYLN